MILRGSVPDLRDFNYTVQYLLSPGPSTLDNDSSNVCVLRVYRVQTTLLSYTQQWTTSACAGFPDHRMSFMLISNMEHPWGASSVPCFSPYLLTFILPNTHLAPLSNRELYSPRFSSNLTWTWHKSHQPQQRWCFFNKLRHVCWCSLAALTLAVVLWADEHASTSPTGQ